VAFFFFFFLAEGFLNYFKFLTVSSNELISGKMTSGDNSSEKEIISGIFFMLILLICFCFGGSSFKDF